MYIGFKPQHVSLDSLAYCFDSAPACNFVLGNDAIIIRVRSVSMRLGVSDLLKAYGSESIHYNVCGRGQTSDAGEEHILAPRGMST